MNITKHFSLDEMTASATAERHGISNAPSVEDMRNLYELCAMLEDVRKMCGGHPVWITSGYRSPELNKIIGGSARSAHCEGRAADFVIPKYGSAHDIVERIVLSDLEYDQVIYEGTWVHLAIGSDPRRQALVATFDKGKVTYSDWEWVA